MSPTVGVDLDDPDMPPAVREYLVGKLVARPADPEREQRVKRIEFTPHSGPGSWKDAPLQNIPGSVKVFPHEQELPEQAAKLRGLYP